MKKLQYLLSLVFLIGCSSVAIDGLNEAQALKGINKCLEAYDRHTGKPVPVEANRAYVHANADQIGIVFAHGEAFGTRSQDYKAVVSCGLLRSNDQLDLYFLGVPSDEPLFRRENSQDVDQQLYTGTFVQMIFNRDAENYVLVSSEVIGSE